MTPPTPARLSSLLSRLMELSHSAWTRFIERECTGDPDLKRHLAEELRRGDIPSGSPLLEVHPVLDRTFNPPAWVDRYRILDLLGEGGMGIVYRAQETGFVKRTVAVKFVLPQRGSTHFRERFERECLALGSLDHPMVARIFTAGATDEGLLYLVMEYVDGPCITRSCRERHLDVEERLRLLESLCLGLAHVHAANYVHRDLKPSNILVTEQNGALIPKIVDFGIAKCLNMANVKHPGLSIEGRPIGTPGYMSPEQLAGSRVTDRRTDIYSLGAVLYELVTGVPPFHPRIWDMCDLECDLTLLRSTPPMPPSVRVASLSSSDSMERLGVVIDSLPYGLDAVVACAMSAHPEARFQSADEMARDIRNVLSGQPVRARGRVLRQAVGFRLRRSRFAISGVVIAALSAGAVMVTEQFRSGESSHGQQWGSTPPWRVVERYAAHNTGETWLTDLDGDSSPEILRVVEHGLILADFSRWFEIALWERRWPDRDIRVGTRFDLEGDGSEEIAIALHDGATSWIEVIDGTKEKGRTKAVFGPIPGVRRSYRSGTQDLEAAPALDVVGTITLDERRLLLVWADYDRDTSMERCLYAFESEGGLLRWARLLPGPLANTVLITEGAQGKPVIVVSLYASNNPQRVGTMDCMHSYVLALDGEGEVLWTQETGPVGGGWMIRTSPHLPGRLISARWGRPADESNPAGEIRLLNTSTGELINEFVSPCPSASSLLDADQNHGDVRFLVTGQDGVLRVLDGDLAPLTERRFEGPANLVALGDLNGDGMRDVVLTVGRELLILDRALDTLAVHSLGSATRVQVLECSPQSRLLLESPDGLETFCLLEPHQDK